MRDLWDLTPEEKLAEELVDEALADVVLPLEMRRYVRVLLLSTLLTAPEGEEMLAYLLAKPEEARRERPPVIDRAMVDEVYDGVLAWHAGRCAQPS